MWYNNKHILVYVFDEDTEQGGIYMKAEQRLGKMLRIFEQEDVVGSMKMSQNPVMVFEAIKRCFARDLELLKEELTATAPIRWTWKLSEEQAVGIVIICLMLEIDDSDMIQNYECIQETLVGSKGYENIQYFLTTGRLFSNERTHNLVNLFFN